MLAVSESRTQDLALEPRAVAVSAMIGRESEPRAVVRKRYVAADAPSADPATSNHVPATARSGPEDRRCSVREPGQVWRRPARPRLAASPWVAHVCGAARREIGGDCAAALGRGWHRLANRPGTAAQPLGAHVPTCEQCSCGSTTMPSCPAEFSDVVSRCDSRVGARVRPGVPQPRCRARASCRPISAGCARSGSRRAAPAGWWYHARFA